MGFRDGDDSGEGGRAGVKGTGRGGRSAETRDATEDTRGWLNEGRTAMLRIGTKG